MGTSRTRQKKRPRWEVSWSESAVPEKRLPFRRFRVTAHHRAVWREWAPVTAATLIVFELLYFFLVADMLGGTSMAGVVVTAAAGCLTVCSRFVQEYARFRRANAIVIPLLTIVVVSVGVMLIAMAAETLSLA
ncbi:hypothetical protein ACFOY2_44860 [Nonomuraea purpurea]|uniref:DUF3017 domain-containing protein n=1 Tax=Nonomuraea purpurea TaxID=1849276 RepID=A0ABV8GNB5_9ACTN